MRDENDTNNSHEENTTVDDAASLRDASGALNYDALSDDDLEAINANGGAIPDDLRTRLEAAQPSGEASGEDADGGENTGENADDEADKAGEAAATGGEFAFTPDANDETFFAEADEFLNNFEDTPETAQMRQIVERYKASVAAQNERLAEVENLGDISQVRAFSSALDKLVVETKQDEQTGVFVPDTTAFRELMKKEYPGEFVQVLEDELTQPSAKYSGYTLMQEIVADHFGFTDEKSRANLENFIRTRGESAIPDFLPAGIEKPVSEAFWKSPERAAIEDRILVLNDILADEERMGYEKDAARQELAGINRNLAMIQQGMDAEKRDRQNEQTRRQTAIQAVEARALQSYEQDAITVERGFAAKIAAKLTVFGGQDSPAARIAARSMATLARDAFSDNASFANAARQDLKELGISFDFQKGFDALDRLYRANRDIVFKEAQIEEAQKTRQPSKVSPRNLEISRRAKADILREVNALETELIGKMMAVVQTGANNALRQKAQVREMPKTRFVPKAKSATGAGGGDKWAHLSDEELDKLAQAEEMLKRQRG